MLTVFTLLLLALLAFAAWKTRAIHHTDAFAAAFPPKPANHRCHTPGPVNRHTTHLSA